MKLQGWAGAIALGLFFTARATAAEALGSPKELGEYLTHHGYGAASLSVTSRGEPLLKTQVNGTDALMVIDSTFPSLLSIHRANVCRLPIGDGGRKLWDWNGPSLNNLGVVSVDSFTINGFEINRTKSIPVMPKPLDLEQGNGIVGYDFLHFNAAIIPVGSEVIFFKPGNGPAVSIESRMRAMGLKPVPMTYGDNGIKIQGQLNGQPFSALLGSGQRYSQFDVTYLDTAHQVWDKTYQQLDDDEGDRVSFYKFRPGTLQLADVVIQPERLYSCNSPWFAHLACSAIIGIDVLASGKAILDFGNNTIWMK